MQINLKLPQHRRDALVVALLNCPSMSDRERRKAVLKDLRENFGDVVDRIVHDPTNIGYTHNIVEAFDESDAWPALVDRVLHYDGSSRAGMELSQMRHELTQHLFAPAQMNALRTLLESVRLDSKQVLQRFHECCRNLDVPDPALRTSPYVLLLTLAGYTEQSEGFKIPALEFAVAIETLLPEPARTKFIAIVDVVAADKKVLQELQPLRGGGQQPTRQLTLVFEMKPKAGAFVLRAHLVDEHGRWTPLLTEDEPVTEAEARRKFRELVSSAEQRSTDLIIEMALSREMFSAPVDRWEIGLGDYNVAVGVHYPVVLRWVNRLRDPRLEPQWGKKWKCVKQHSGDPLWLLRTNDYSPSQLLALLNQAKAPEKGAFISLAFSPLHGGGTACDDALSIALNGGTPVALWWRDCVPDPIEAQRELQALLKINGLHDLPSLLQSLRNEAEQGSDPKHPGRRLVLLYDNHDHRPPQLTESN
jgi:hypothetical protein